MGWIWLICGGLFEVAFTTCLRFVDGFRNIPWTIGFLFSTCMSLLLLEWASRTIPVGTAYAVWGAVGAVGTVSVGIIWFGESAQFQRLALLGIIIMCVICLKLIEKA